MTDDVRLAMSPEGLAAGTGTELWSEAGLFRLASFFRTLGDPTRLNILFVLTRGERTVGALAKEAGLSISAVSHQLGALRSAGLVAVTREGKSMRYRLDDSHVHGIIQLARDHLSEPRGL